MYDAGVAVCVRSRVTWRRQGRPRPHLHADDTRSDHCHVGLRSHRRNSLAGLWRIRVQGTRHQDQPCRGIGIPVRVFVGIQNSPRPDFY